MISIGQWQHRRFHGSYLIGWLSVGVLAGLLLSKSLQYTANPVGLVVFVLLCIPALRSRRWWTVGLAVFMGIVLGISRGSAYMSQLTTYERSIGKNLVVTGTVSTDPQVAKGLTTFQLSDVTLGREYVPSEVYVSVTGDKELKRGDGVQLTGRLKEGFVTYQGTLSYAKVLSVSKRSDVIGDVRERFVASVREYVAEPMASLGVGFVVGQRSSLPPTLDDQLRIVGLTHIVVASGYNLTILVRFARRLLARHSRYLALVTSLALMCSFVAFSGLSPSMNRAVAVTGLSLLAWYYGRRFHPLLLIGYVAAVTAMWNPVYVWSDLGWYLSFFAFGGVLILAPLITVFFFKDKEQPALTQLVIETLSAELMTLPLIALAFGVFPTFGLLANIAVGPVIPFAMIATTLAGVAGMVAPALAPLFALLSSVIIGYVVAIVEFLSSIEWAQLSASITLSFVAVWFAGITVLALLIWYRRGYDFRSNAITD